MEKPKSMFVGLYIEDEKFRDHVKFILKARGIVAIDAQNIQNAPFDVVLTDGRSVPPGLTTKTMSVEKGFSDEELVWAIEVLMKLPGVGKKVVVGIDPGKKMGAAVLCGNILIDSKVTDKTSELKDWIDEIRKIAKPKIMKVRVGKGERWMEIVDALEEGSCIGMKVEAVDESHTTKSLAQWNRCYGKDVVAAIRIALRV